MCTVYLQWTALTPTVQAMAPVSEASVTAKQGGRVPTAVLWISRCTSAYLDAQSMAVMTWRPEHASVIIIGLVQIVHRVCMPSYRLYIHYYVPCARILPAGVAITLKKLYFEVSTS